MCHPCVTHVPPISHPEADLAVAMLRAIPKRALNIIKGGNFGGADLVKLDSEISRPSFRDHLGLDCVLLLFVGVYVEKDNLCSKLIQGYFVVTLPMEGNRYQLPVAKAGV